MLRQTTIAALSAFVLLGSFASAIAQEHNDAGGLQQVPDDTAQSSALKLVKDVYGEEYASAKTTDQKLTLAKKLLRKSEETRNEPTNQYVLLRLAKDFAAQAGDSQTAFAAIDAMARSFKIDSADIKSGTLTMISKKAHSAPEHVSIAKRALSLTDEALTQDNYDLAGQLAELALEQARIARSTLLIQQAKTRMVEMGEMATAHEKMMKAASILERTPDDPEANCAVGKYFCLFKGDWDKGIPMLALGNDEPLKALARKELGEVPDAKAQAAIGDAWWDLGGNNKDLTMKRYQQRSAYWYSMALPGLNGLVKDKVNMRLAAIAKTDQDETASAPVNAHPPLATAPFSEKTAKQHQARWAKYLRVPTVETNSIGMKLVLIPPGEFELGSADGEGNADEHPKHWVRITKPFWLGVTDVTQEEYECVMHTNPSKFKGNKARGDPKRPVEQVTWDEAVEFCRRLSELSRQLMPRRQYALPTEAQWEYACRAGSTTQYYFGDDERLLAEYGWYSVNSGGWDFPVAQKRANVWGLYDMHGNVFEWCRDLYDDKYYGRSMRDDPTGPAGGSDRVLRGGGWDHRAAFCRSAKRMHYAPGFRYSALGFRVSLALADK